MAKTKDLKEDNKNSEDLEEQKKKGIKGKKKGKIKGDPVCEIY